MVGGCPTPLKNDGVRQLGWNDIPKWMEHKIPWFQSPPTSIFIPWTHSSTWKPYSMTMETIWKPYGNHMETIWKPYGNHMETIWKPIHIYPLKKSLNCPRPLRSGWPRCRPSPSAGRWGLPTISCRRSGCPPKWCDLRWRSTTWMRMSRFCRYITLWLCQNSYWTWP